MRAPMAERFEAVPVSDVALDRLTGAVVGVRVARHSPYAVALLEQGASQVGPDEPRGAGDQHGTRHR